MDIVTLAHGSGGINAAEFVQKVFMPISKTLCPMQMKIVESFLV